MKRRDFLKTGLVAAGGVALGAALPKDAAARRKSGDMEVGTAEVAPAGSGGWYTPNRAPLAPAPFQKLPPGSIKPQGWLAEQLALQVGGLCGRYPKVSDYLKYDGNGWVTPNTNSGWEEVTYWLRGLADLGYVTGDKPTIALAEKWIKGMIASQQPDGWFGPSGARTSLDGDPDFWPHMPALYAIRSYHEVTGDPQVLPFLTHYFAFQNQQKPELFSKSWAGYRWGDNIDSIYWLYNRTGDAFLLDLVQKIHANAYDWTHGPPNLHNVNFAQGFREPAQFGVLGRDPKFFAASERQYHAVMAEFGQMPGGGFAGDENARPGYGDPRQGFETCGIAEYMLSFEILTRQSGQPAWMDRCEELAFNMLPASYDPEQKSMHYVTSMNIAQIDNTPKGKDFDNPWPMQAFMPGVHNYRCCPHNYGMAWPYFAENLWHATADNGLAANLYAASEVTAKVGGDGVAVTLTQATEYPFSDTVHLTLTAAKPTSFPLYLRIPAWCDTATVRVNGRPVSAQPAAGSYLVLHQTWKSGDTVALHLPMTVRVRKWTANQNAVSVDRGPLTYSLAIGEKWDRYAGTAQWPEYAVYAETPWNYGLVVDEAHPEHSFHISTKGGPVAANPFTHDTTPITLRARAKKILNWQMDSKNVITPLQPSPARSAEKTETVSLIPMGAARLRLTAFPVIGDGPDAHEWTAPLRPDVAASASVEHDDIAALSNSADPAKSFDTNTPRFTWWDHKGTPEWVQYDLAHPKTISAAAVYWYDDTGSGECRVPKSWRLTYKRGDAWVPVTANTEYETDQNQFNTIKFAPVTASAFRLEVQLQAGYSGGILRWRLS